MHRNLKGDVRRLIFWAKQINTACMNRVASIEAEFLEYKGKTSQDISNILVQLSYSENVIKKQELELQQQGEEIVKLTSVNLHLHEIVNNLKSKICQLEPTKLLKTMKKLSRVTIPQTKVIVQIRKGYLVMQN